MFDPRVHLDTETLHRELRDVALHRPRLDRPDYQRHGRLRRRLKALVVAPEQVVGRVGRPVPDVTIRPARTGDSYDLTRLAEISERDVPSGLVLVAEVDSSIVAALPVEGGALLSDLRRPIGDVHQLLELRSEQLRVRDRRRAA
jgi:hypothetical protein